MKVLKDNYKNDITFFLNDEETEYLCRFGLGNDLTIKKTIDDTSSTDIYQYFFDYKGLESTVLGKYGNNHPLISKLIVIQFD